jgi:hypothetical protein
MPAAALPVQSACTAASAQIGWGCSGKAKHSAPSPPGRISIVTAPVNSREKPKISAFIARGMGPCTLNANQELNEMPCIDATKMTDQALDDFDAMMVECVTKVEKFASLATTVWTDVLKELDRRGKVKLVSGSYDDLGNALITRVK